MAVLTVLGGGTLLAAQVQGDLEAGVAQVGGPTGSAFEDPRETPPLELNDFRLPDDLPLDIPRGARISPDLSSITFPEDVNIRIPDDLDLGALDFELPEDFTLELPEGTLFSPPGLELPNGGTIRLPNGESYTLPHGSKLDLPPELVERLLADGLPAGTLPGDRAIKVDDLPPELSAQLDPPEFEGGGNLRLPAGSTITLPDGRQFPFPPGALPYAARYLLPPGTRIDPALEGGSAAMPVPSPDSPSQLVEGRVSRTQLYTEITGMPSRVRKGDPVTVSGYVRDGNGNGVARVPVDVFLNESKRAPGVLVGQGASDSSGTFVIRLELPADKPAREYQLVNHAVGFTDASGRQYVDGWGDPPLATYAGTTLTLELPAREGIGVATTIAGTLVDNTGAPVVGASLTLDVDGVLLARPVTNTLGRFAATYEFGEGTHVVEARFGGNANYEASAIARRTITIDDYAIEVAPTVSGRPGDALVLTGRVLGQGAAVPEREVVVEPPFGPPVSVVTDGRGRFSAAMSIPAHQTLGPYTITYRLPDLGIAKAQALAVEQTGRFTLVVPTQWDVEEPIPVSVTLATPEGAILGGQTIRLTLAGPGGTSDSTYTVGGEFTTSISPLRKNPGSYTLTARVVGNPYLDAPSANAALSLGTFEVAWSIPSTVVRGSDASGAVDVRFDGKPLADTALTLDFFGPKEIVTDTNGRAAWTERVDASAGLGEQTISVGALSHPTRTATMNVVVVPQIDITAPERFAAGRTVDATVRLTDDQGEPIRDADVTLTSISPEGLSRRVVRTDDRGEWRGALNLTGEQGNVSLSARYDGGGPYLGAETLETLSATAPRSRPQGLWLLPLVGLVAAGTTGAFYLSKRRKRPVETAPAPAIFPAVVLSPPDADVRFAIADDEPDVWGVGEPVTLALRNRGADGAFDLAWPGGTRRVDVKAGQEARVPLAFDAEGEIELTASRVGAVDAEPARASLRVVDYRKETARAFDLFLAEARKIDASLTRQSTPREIAWTLEMRVGEDARERLHEMALVLEITNYSQHAISRDHYLRFRRAARAVEPLLSPAATTGA